MTSADPKIISILHRQFNHLEQITKRGIDPGRTYSFYAIQIRALCGATRNGTREGQAEAKKEDRPGQDHKTDSETKAEKPTSEEEDVEIMELAGQLEDQGPPGLSKDGSDRNADKARREQDDIKIAQEGNISREAFDKIKKADYETLIENIKDLQSSAKGREAWVGFCWRHNRGNIDPRDFIGCELLSRFLSDFFDSGASAGHYFDENAVERAARRQKNRDEGRRSAQEQEKEFWDYVAKRFGNRGGTGSGNYNWSMQDTRNGREVENSTWTSHAPSTGGNSSSSSWRKASDAIKENRKNYNKFNCLSTRTAEGQHQAENDRPEETFRIWKEHPKAVMSADHPHSPHNAVARPNPSQTPSGADAKKLLFDESDEAVGNFDPLIMMSESKKRGMNEDDKQEDREKMAKRQKQAEPPEFNIKTKDNAVAQKQYHEMGEKTALVCRRWHLAENIREKKSTPEGWFQCGKENCVATFSSHTAMARHQAACQSKGANIECNGEDLMCRFCFKFIAKLSRKEEKGKGKQGTANQLSHFKDTHRILEVGTQLVCEEADEGTIQFPAILGGPEAKGPFQ